MPEICIFQPAGEPIHIEEAKLDRRVSDSADNSRIRSLIAAARQSVETITRQQLMHARYQLTLNSFPTSEYGAQSLGAANIPSCAVRLPHAPLVRVVSIQYVDMGGVVQTMPTSDYVVNNANMPGLVAPVFGKIWPISIPQIGAVTITYDAGYASPIKVTGVPTAQFVVTGPVTFAVADRVQFYNSGDADAALPAPLDVDASYFISAALSSGVYTLNDSNGNPVTFTDSGAGIGRSFIGVVPDGLRSWMLLRIGSLYENREEVAIMQKGGIKELPYVDFLLDPYKISLP